MSKSSLFRAIALAFSLVIFLQFQAAAAQGSTERFAITGVDSAEFPQVSLVVRALDAEGRAVTGLHPADFEITENDRPMAIDSLEEVDGGLWTHFVIDAGAGMQGDRWAKAREAVTSYLEANSWMRNGLDHVAITAIEAGGPRVLTDYTTDRAQLLNAIEQYDPPGGGNFSAPMRPIADLIEQLDLNPDARDQPKFVTLITPGLESETGRSTLIQTARDKGVIINTILARSEPRIPCTPAQGGGTRPVCDENLRDLALETGGEFTAYSDRNSPNGLFTRMEAARRQYQISYRSDLGESGTHQVAIANASGARATTSFSVVVDPIRILIDSPTEGEVILREAAAYTEDRGSIPPQSFTVVATPIFPDVRRRIMEAELLVNGAVASRVEFPGETIELPWNLRTIAELGVNEQTLQVRILDELGIETVSQPANVKVEVIVPPKPDIPDAIATVMVEGIFPTPTPIPCPLPDAACGPYRAVRGNWVSAASLAVATLALAFAGIVYVNRDKEVVRNATARVTRAVETLTRRQTTAKARAYLKILGGDEDTGRLLPIHGDTRIGRSRSNADIHFRGDEEESVISRLHCTIVDMESHFEIKDESSSYGTFLNGARLTPLVPEKLSDGDEIELAQVQRGGVKLKFQLAGDDELGAGLTETRRTRKRKAAEKAENQGGEDF